MKNADETHVQYVKDAGIDFLICRPNETFLNLCDDMDVGVIASGYNAPSMYWSSSDTSAWYNIDSSTYKDHKCIWGDDVIDEPTADFYDEIASIIKHYYANTTGKIPLVNLFPNYANEEQLGETKERYINKTLEGFALDKYNFFDITKREMKLYGPLENAMYKLLDISNGDTNKFRKYVSDYINKIDTDYISVDIYPLHDGNETLSDWLRGIDILAEACRKTGRNLWVITQAAGMKDSGPRFCDTPEDIRWQMYTSLAFGAKAVIHACYNSGWWDTDSHLIDADGNRTATYYAVQTVDNEVAPFAKIYGNYKYIGTFLTNAYAAAGTDSGYLTPLDEDSKCTVNSKSPVLTGCFKSDDGRAYTFVNMNETLLKLPATIEVEFDDASEITIYRKGVATKVEGNSFTMKLENEEGIYVTVK